MLIPILAGVLTLVTFVLGVLWRGVLAIQRRPAPRYWRHAFLWHVGLFLFHALVTVPLGLGVLASRFVGTRGDEAAYQGPRLDADGNWLVQSRETLAAEAAENPVGGGTPEAPSAPVPLAVSFSARDGVTLQGFLVPPRAQSLSENGLGENDLGRNKEPRFSAVLVHGLYRSALEIETPGRMLRDLGGEVLLLELRNHGGSGAARPTFGLDESLDVLAAVDFMKSRPDAGDRPLVLFAVSLGTAAAALAAPQIPDLDALILDAPMDDLRATSVRMLSRLPASVPVVSGYWRSTIQWSAEHLAGIPFDRVDPRASLARLPPDVSVLVIGAGHDWRMPPESVQALFESLPTDPGRKTLWIDPDATHGKVWVTSPDEYRLHLRRLLETATVLPEKLAPEVTSKVKTPTNPLIVLASSFSFDGANHRLLTHLRNACCAC